MMIQTRESTTHLAELAAYVQERHPYPLLFATIGGSHAFGYASEYSDYDIHGMHQVPLDTVLGFDHARGESVEVKDDLEHPETGQPVEVATHELRKFLRLLLNGNGNVLEDLYSPLVVISSPLHEELKELGRGCFSLRHAFHYKGMAFNHQRKMKGNETKKFLHMFRCLMMGTYLMETGELELHLPTLADYYDEPCVEELIKFKTGPDSTRTWSEVLVGLMMEQVKVWESRLLDASAESVLPARPGEQTKKALETILWRERRKELSIHGSR